MRHRAQISSPHAQLAFSLLCGLVCCSGNAAEIIHKGYSQVDRSVSCISRAYGKKVIWLPSITNFGFSECPEARKAIEEKLRNSGIRVFESNESVYLIPDSLFSPKLNYWERQKWSGVRVVFNPVSRTTNIADDELKNWSDVVLRNDRLIPAAPPVDPKQTGTVVISINLKFYRVRLSQGKPDNVIVIVDQLPDGAAGRIVFGEIRDGQLSVLWESPLFDAWGLPIFQDVNGDGEKEIIFESSTGGNRQYPRVFIFDQQGNEITRQKSCDLEGEPFSMEDGVCAIGGERIEFVPELDVQGGSKQIEVENWDVDHLNHVFRLQRGVFAPVPQLGKSKR